MLRDLIKKNRSYRKFHADIPVSMDELKSLIDLARITPSSKNRQPLKYILVTDPKDTAHVFNQLKWAKHLKDWDGPSENERPPSYIIMMQDNTLNDLPALIDAGISAQSILLGAVEKGLGGCIIRSVNRERIAKYFKLEQNLEIIQVIAIGKPNQKISLVEVSENKTAYFEENSVHHVPKRNLDDLIYGNDAF